MVNGYSATFGVAFEIWRRRGRLPCVREPEQGGVGEQLEAELGGHLLPRQAGLGDARRPAGGGREAGCRHHPGRRERAAHALRRAQDRRRDAPPRRKPAFDRYPKDDVLAVPAAAVRPLPVPPALGAEVALPTERRQVAQVGVGEQDDAAAAAAVTPSGPPFGTYFSRRKLRAPSPPRPPWATNAARSANTILLPSGA